MEISLREKLKLRSILLILIMLILASYAYMLYSTDDLSKYYSYNMFLGPLSRSVYVFALYVAGILLATSLLIVLRDVNVLENTHLYAYIALALAVLFAKYFLPQYFDSAYFENFYDAGGHMVRGRYVTLTGFSNVKVDTYFDTQPGFFWWTAVFINIVYGTPTSPQDYIFLHMIKWFNIFILSLYIPILVSFFRTAGLSLKESFLGYTAFVLLSLSRFHYSAQVFSYVLYWLALTELLKLLLRENGMRFSNICILILISASIIFVHQGTTLFTLTTMLALFIGIMFPLTRLRINVSTYTTKSLLVFISSFTLLWFIYLGYLTVYTFGNFLQVIKSVILSIIEMEIPSFVQQAVRRSYELWHQIVLVKASYMALLVSLSLIILLIIALTKNRNESTVAKAFTFIITALASVIGIIALTLGGTGYVERIPEALAPIVVYSMLKQKSFGSLFLIALCLLGGVLYFAGWNFQSVTYSEPSALGFIIIYGPNTAVIYSNMCIQGLFYPIFPYKPMSNCLYIEFRSNNIQAIYYLVGSPQPLEEANNMLTKNFNLIYRSPTASVYQR